MCFCWLELVSNANSNKSFPEKNPSFVLWATSINKIYCSGLKPPPCSLCVRRVGVAAEEAYLRMQVFSLIWPCGKPSHPTMEINPCMGAHFAIRAFRILQTSDDGVWEVGKEMWLRKSATEQEQSEKRWGYWSYMTYFTETCALLAEIAKTFRMIIINISWLSKKTSRRPPVGQNSEPILIGYETSAVGGGGKSTLGISPQNQTLVPPGPPMTSASTCLLFMTPGRSKGTRQEDAFTLCLWAASLLWWDGKLSGVSGTPSAARPDSNRECVGQRHRAVERWSPKLANLSF